ncbi:copper amine oxidase [Paenalkalicoccus suaedae]|uniref:Copper amine oxidase n=1 Tax=Paenalkalicoccus suaedae TaxID=2592382 RepID=A0A859FGZ5_9BACI|nr:stalk domain-containing protein [Paenalkalicoccus suaedae]QKS72397.1 copper amine oxidase [Paenalkalicoccus suaedae]
MQSKFARRSLFRTILFVVVALVWFLPVQDILEQNSYEVDSRVLAAESVTLNGGRIENARTLIPFRSIFEEMGAEVAWNDRTRTVTAKRGNSEIVLTIDSRSAVINGSAVTLDVAPQIFGNSTYVPLRFVSESFGAEAKWDTSTRVATVIDEGKRINVTIGTPSTPTSNQQASGNVNRPPASSTTIQVSGIALGDSASKVTQSLGQPVHVSTSEYGFQWHTYHQNYREFRMIGIQQGKVVALYTNSNHLSTPEGVHIGQTKTQVRQRLGTPATYILKGNSRYQQRQSDEFELYQVDNGYMTVFYDLHLSGGHQVTAVQVIDKSVEESLRAHYGTGNQTLRQGFTRQLFDLINSDRVKFGLAPLTLNNQVSSVALAHSTDMANRSYFSHTTPEGLSPFDRMRKAGLTYYTAGENIATGQSSSIFAHQGLMNSAGHRRNLLNSTFKEVGVGVAFSSTDRPYYTQKFYTK